MSQLARLAENYQKVVSTPWSRSTAGAQRTILVVYEKERERSLRANMSLFRAATEDAGHGWVPFDCTPRFAEWLGSERYREKFFANPAALTTRIEPGFVKTLADSLRETLRAAGPDDAVALTGVASLYGFTRLSTLLHSVETDIRGRLVVFFPGRQENDTYRLLGVRDGWNYLAPCVTAERIQPGR